MGERQEPGIAFNTGLLDWLESLKGYRSLPFHSKYEKKVENRPKVQCRCLTSEILLNSETSLIIISLG
jgi:hypothetical protein